MCPSVAAGAALESAVFERASCVFFVRGGRACAHNREKAGLWRPSPILKSNVWKCVQGCMQRDDFFLWLRHTQLQ